jgi:hypothetical protein
MTDQVCALSRTQWAGLGVWVRVRCPVCGRQIKLTRTGLVPRHYVPKVKR